MSLSEFGILVMLGISGIHDLQKKTISLWVLSGFLVGGMLLLFLGFGITWEQALCGAGIGIVICGLSVLTRGSIGIGDGMVLCVCGIYLGYTATIWIFLMASIFCAMTAGVMLVTKRANKKTRLPFVPFLWGACLILVMKGVY